MYSEEEGFPKDRIPLLPQDQDFGWVAKWQPAKVGIFSTWISKQRFFKAQSYDVNRDVVCQLPPEARHPTCTAARLKKPAYGWDILDNALRCYGMVPTRAD